MTKYFVLLTGDKENSGDFLIRDSAEHLLRHARPDREVRVLPAWKPFDRHALEVVNDATALILCGGPGLRPKMWPGIYPLTDNLDDIRVPITLMGSGWKGFLGEPEKGYADRFHPRAIELIGRIERDGLGLSVRDMCSAEVLRHLGVNNIHLTGCPVLFRQVCVTRSPPQRETPSSDYYVFSPGALMGESHALEHQARVLLQGLKQRYDGQCVVAFHHHLGLGSNQTTAKGLQLAQESLRQWLDDNGVSYVELAGGHERMKTLYSAARFHIGYRVHAHLLCSALGVPTVLINEDGRGIGASRTLEELDHSAFRPRFKNAYMQAGLSRLGQMSWNIQVTQPDLLLDGLETMDDRHKSKVMMSLWERMKLYVENLP